MARTATFLFAAGQETTAKLLSAAIKALVERPDLQQALRKDRSLIPTFVEESLRLESPVKSDSAGPPEHDARRHEHQGRHRRHGVARCGQPRSAAVHRPPRIPGPQAQRPRAHRVRPRCPLLPGAPLARVEGRVSLERMLDRMGEITIDEEFHGSAENRRYNYEPTYILRGLADIHVRFTGRG